MTEMDCPPHRWIIEQGGHQPGRCKKCGVTKDFGRTWYDPSNMEVRHLAPPLDVRTKALLFLRKHDGVRVEWDAFRAAVGCSYKELSRAVKELLKEGAAVEVEELTYALVEQ